MTARALGIDLGTTYTVVATIDQGRPRIVPNAEGQRLTPSVVAFTAEGRLLVGQPARLQAWANPAGTVFSIKRRMGTDARVHLGARRYTPQGISSLILQKVKADAEERLGERLDQAVITVPAYFNDRQRQATREAGRLAGLDVLRIISEPTAAALAYGLEREDAHTVLVWDLGGGTFDVSILELGEGIFEVRAVSGDARLGGDDFDQRVGDYLADQYRRQYGEDLPADGRARQALREAAEKAKIQLSSTTTARVFVPCLVDAPATRGATPWHLDLVLTRAQLEGLTADLLARLLVPTQQALADAGLRPQDVDRVVLVGGATRMPAVRALVRRIIGKEPYRYLDPDEVVALGAAVQAGMLQGLVEKAALLDVLPLSLGVETQGGLVAPIIPRNTPLPAAEGQVFTTAVDSQTAMDVHVVQGERALAADNVSLGQLHLAGIPPVPRGTARVEVTFAADVDGIVHVTARELWTEATVEAKLAGTKLLDSAEIEHLAAAARQSACEDQERRARIQAAIEADHALAAAGMALDALGGPATNPHVPAIAGAARRVKEALAGGAVDEVRRSCAALRQCLAAAPSTEYPLRAP